MKTPAIGVEALNAPDYRAFLLAILRAGNSEIPRGSLAALARRSGLSRSFLTELFKGKKALSGRSSAKLAEALGLRGDLRRYFETLVAAEENDMREQSGVRSEADLATRRKALQVRLLQKHRLQPRKTRNGGAVLSIEVFCVYAALGLTGQGVTLSEVSRRTGMDPVKVNRVLETMISIDWIHRVDDEYFASEKALDLEDMGCDLGFVQAFAESALELAKKSRQIAADAEALTFFSVAPISVNKMGEFKARLRSAVLDILDEFQDDSGVSVQLKKVTLGMH